MTLVAAIETTHTGIGMTQGVHPSLRRAMDLSGRYKKDKRFAWSRDDQKKDKYDIRAKINKWIIKSSDLLSRLSPTPHAFRMTSRGMRMEGQVMAMSISGLKMIIIEFHCGSEYLENFAFFNNLIKFN